MSGHAIRRCLAYTVRQPLTRSDISRIEDIAERAAEDAASDEVGSLVGDDEDFEVVVTARVDVDAWRVRRSQSWIEVDPITTAAVAAAGRVREGEILTAAEWVEMPGQESLLP